MIPDERDGYIPDVGRKINENRGEGAKLDDRHRRGDLFGVSVVVMKGDSLDEVPSGVPRVYGSTSPGNLPPNSAGYPAT